MNELILIDTDILIDAGRQISEAVDCLNNIETKYILAVSVITHMELLTGCRNKTELRRVEHFLQRFLVVVFGEEICKIAINLLRQYRLSHGLLIPDALIAATAISQKLKFISKNQRDYRFIHELKLLSYPETIL